MVNMTWDSKVKCKTCGNDVKWYKSAWGLTVEPCKKCMVDMISKINSLKDLLESLMKSLRLYC